MGERQGIRADSDNSRFRSLWGLPGGFINYRDALAHMGVLARSSASRDEVAKKICRDFETVSSMSTAKGYVSHVLRPIGVVVLDRDGQILEVSAQLSSGKPISKSKLRSSLISRVEGVSEILRVIQKTPLAMRHIHAAKGVQRLAWSSDWPLRYRLNWLRAAGAVERLPERASSERYPQWVCTKVGIADLREWS